MSSRPRVATLAALVAAGIAGAFWVASDPDPEPRLHASSDRTPPPANSSPVVSPTSTGTPSPLSSRSRPTEKAPDPWRHGLAANGESGTTIVSDDGRYVVFDSAATNLVPRDTNRARDVFVRDVRRGTTERVSLSSGGRQANNDSLATDISSDGRFVVFRSLSSNLVPHDTNHCDVDDVDIPTDTCIDVFVRDRATNRTLRVSVSSDGTQGNSHSDSAVISADGRYVSFLSGASNLVPDDTNDGVPCGDDTPEPCGVDVFVHDLITGATERVSVTTDEEQASGSLPRISADGRFVSFSSRSANLTGDPNGSRSGLFIRDRVAATTTRVPTPFEGTKEDLGVYEGDLSGDGQIVAFVSSHLVPSGSGWSGRDDVVVWDRGTGMMDVLTSGNHDNVGSVRISRNGRYVAYHRVTDPDTIDLYDRVEADTTRVTVSKIGGRPNGFSLLGGISSDGGVVSFWSPASNLVARDTNQTTDAFIRDVIRRMTIRVSLS